MSGDRSLPRKSVVLTFDDGYLDNWIYVIPLLRKYGMTGVVYVSPEFVQPGDTIRPMAAESGGSQQRVDATDAIGFMNWAELRAADSEGVLDVQCHALTHTWYFSSPFVHDVHRPRDIYPYPWMSWNLRPERKPWYLNEFQDDFVEWGHPVFEHEKSLITKRFFPDPEAVEEICGFIRENGGREFFGSADWKGALLRRFPVFAGKKPFPGHMESGEQYAVRVRHELTESKHCLESQLGKAVHFLSWPGGGVNDTAAAIATDIGFLSSTLLSWQKPDFRNTPGSDPTGIKRINGRSKVIWRGRWIANGGAWWIVHRMLMHQGSLLSTFLTRLRKIFWIAGISGGARKATPPADRKAP
jgi:peptidoglycan/xylan/chitin deacetylase (PgdA/CDA1 family)